MSFDVQKYYERFPSQIDEILSDGYQNSINSGLFSDFGGDTSRLGTPDGNIGLSYYWTQSEVILLSDEDDHAKLTAAVEGDRIVFKADQSVSWERYLDLTNGATYVDDVVVIGQRRDYPSQPYPDRSIPPGQPGSINNPCSNASTAIPWNADAASIQANEDFLLKAAELGFADSPNGKPTLGVREFGRGLARGPNNSVWGNAVSYGSPTSGPHSTMTIDFSGINTSNYLGDAHSHPNGNPLPSKKDWDGFMVNNLAARKYGRTSETYYMFITTVGSDGQPDKTYVYEDGPRSADSPNPAKTYHNWSGSESKCSTLSVDYHR